MTEAEARGHLQDMLASFTAGSVLMLLSELYRERAEQAGDAGAADEYRRAEDTLFVVALGIDAIRPG